MEHREESPLLLDPLGQPTQLGYVDLGRRARLEAAGHQLAPDRSAAAPGWHPSGERCRLVAQSGLTTLPQVSQRIEESSMRKPDETQSRVAPI
jgi:hypothetical protein